MKMSDRKEYHKAYYQNKVKVKRALEREASTKLPELLQDLTASRVQNQILQADKSDLQRRLQELEEAFSILSIERNSLNEECIQKSEIISSLSRSVAKR